MADFDGCHRECRTRGAHTLVWGGCEHAPEPEPTVSLSRVYTAADGLPAIGFETYTVQDRAALESSLSAMLGEPVTLGVGQVEMRRLPGESDADLMRRWNASRGVTPEQAFGRFLDHIAEQAALLGLDANIVASLANGTAEILISRKGK